jgi:hypothetical protein
MGDLIYVAIIVAFFAVAALFVVACDYIIGPDEAGDVSSPAAADPVPDRQPVAS